MLFWIIIGLMGLAVAATLARAMLRGKPGAEPPAAYDLALYRDQLGELDRDVARGVIAEAEAERARTEISRRILAADTALKTQEARASAGRGARVVGLVLIAAVVIGATALYWTLGAPGYGDLALKDRIAAAEQARVDRPRQAEAEEGVPPFPGLPEPTEQFLDLMEKLRATVAERPDDLQGALLLARNEAALGNFRAAYRAQADVLRLKGDAATASDYADFADMMILAAGGYVSPEAEVALREALARDDDNGAALYYTGLLMEQTGRPDVAFRIWNRLLRRSPPDAPWIAPIRGQIEDVAFRAGVEFELPPLQYAPGPSAEDVEAAQDMTAEDRQAMIEGMVAQLSDRLATEGGSPEEWARLIGALGVLERRDRARAIWQEALAVFAGNDEALAIIAAGAARAGLIE